LLEEAVRKSEEPNHNLFQQVSMLKGDEAEAICTNVQ